MVFLENILSGLNPLTETLVIEIGYRFAFLAIAHRAVGCQTQSNALLKAMTM